MNIVSIIHAFNLIFFIANEKKIVSETNCVQFLFPQVLNEKHRIYICVRLNGGCHF